MRIFLALPLALAACIEAPEVPGRALYAAECADCHGDDARGAGPFGRKLLKIPPDLTVLAKDNGGIFPRDYVMSVIDGLDRGPHFSGAMPEFGAGDLGRVVIVEETPGQGTPIPQDLLALADYLESLQLP